MDVFSLLDIFVTFLGALSACFINNWSLNKGLFPSSMQKYIGLFCGLCTNENLAWWSRSKPDNETCVFLALNACHELPFPIHYSSTSELRFSCSKWLNFLRNFTAWVRIKTICIETTLNRNDLLPYRHIFRYWINYFKKWILLCGLHH